MTLDEFLRTLETLIDDRETNDDDPGEGNFGCEDCRKCNHCRFCIGCDSCTDCTYCEESIDCTSCTQSKRCVSCEKVSYCEDCRDCKGSRYLTLCVDCTDCVHCLGCVGLEGAEFYVLNEKRTRKEYFALLRQVQELMRERMTVGWRPSAIGLASEIDDPSDLIMAGRDVELTAAHWLEQLRPAPEPAPQRSVRDYDYDERDYDERDYDERDYDERDYDKRDRARGYEERGRERPGPPPAEPRARGVVGEPERSRPERSRPAADEYPNYDYEPPRRAREPRRVERDEFEERRPPARSPATRPLDQPGAREPERGRVLGRDRDRDWDRDWDREPRRRENEAATSRRAELGPRPIARHGDERPDEHQDDHWDDRPVAREYGWEDSRERTVARPRREHQLREPAAPIDDDPLDDVPDQREQEPSSPWLDEEAQARRRAKRGSLRRAGRPTRKPDPEPARESTGSASYRTGSAPARNEGTQTGTGLRLGRKPKR